MKLIEQSHKIVSKIDLSEHYKECLLSCAQGYVLCYDEQMDYVENIEDFIRKRINMGRESIVEHAFLSILFTINKELSRELIRHQLCSFTQISARYNKESIECIRPHWFDKEKNEKILEVNRQKMIELAKDNILTDTEYTYLATLVDIEESYKLLQESELLSEDARGVLPNALATKVLITCTIEEWRHILRLYNTDKPHPDIKRLMSSLLKDLKEAYPVFFEDIDENN